MIKVVILQEYVPDYRVPFFEQLVRAAAADGIEVIIAAGRPNRAQDKRGDSAEMAFITHIPQREFRVGARRLVIRRTAKVIAGADLVIMEQARRNIDAYRLLLPKFTRRQRWALWGHGRDYTESRNWFSKWLQKVLTLRADWFFAYTPGGASHLAASAFPPDRITKVMNSTDTKALRAELDRVSSEDQEQWRERHNVRGRVIAFIGALDESKRIPLLIEAASLLDEEALSLVIAGEGPKRDEFEKLASSLDNVHFIGRTGGESKVILMSLSHMLVIPGRVGLIAVDSLAAGVPIVTTDWPYHAPEFEYLEDGKTCLVAQNTSHDYARTINRLLNDEKLRSDITTNCLAAADLFGVHEMSRNFLVGIQQAIRQDRR